ncbi:hypothetical protein VV869_15390 [Photobacterium sp. MCCC 1A19761]|uniref:hypothetical protein n=1 Tax=Photobacterium sp. MCCC 1A19761 TaxID=3115000 RepID=UPI00307E5234
MLNIFIVIKLFLKYIIVPVINVILSLCVLAGGFYFIIFTFGGWLPETCSVDGIRCYSLMLSMAFGSIVLVLGVLTRILIHLSSELHEYKKKLYRGIAFGYGKIQYFIYPIGFLKEIYLSYRTNSMNRKLYLISKLIHYVATYSAFATMIFLFIGILSAVVYEM